MKHFYPLLFVLVIFCSSVQAQNYYVSNTSGDDSYSGTSTSQPFATIQKAANVAGSGSTVHVMAGTYYEKVVTNINSGTATTPITFKPYNNDIVYIDGGGISSTPYSELWRIEGVHHVIVDGFIFQNQEAIFVIGLIVRPGCDNITVTNCTFRNIHFSGNQAEFPNPTNSVASPLSAWGNSSTQDITNITFTNNEIYNCRLGYGEGMTFAGNVDGFVAEGNYVHDVTNIGIVVGGNRGVCPDPTKDQARNGVIRYNELHDCVSLVATAGQIYSDGARDILIEHNVTHHGTIGIALNGEVAGKTSSNFIIRNNLIYKNGYTGFQVAHAKDSLDPTIISKVMNIEISGNTFYTNDTAGVWAGEMNIEYAENLTIHNNIFFSDNIHDRLYNYYPSNGTGNVLDYNTYYTRKGVSNSIVTYSGGTYPFPTYQATTGQDAHSIFADPKFEDTMLLDFHLDSLSPAINAGDPQYITATSEVDVDGQPRVKDTIDCGMDETYYANVPTSVQSIADNEVYRIYPNPANDYLTLNLSQASTKHPTMLMITDVAGRLCWSGWYRASLTTVDLDLSSFQTGTYFLSIRKGMNGQTLKFLKR